jgi:hypothetical protein
MYTGTIDEGNHIVTRDGGKKLDPRFDIINHSPTGFCWGYGGSGPAQLSLAILCDYLKDDQYAKLLYHDFKFLVIAKLPMDEGFVLTECQIEDAITAINIERMKRQ